MASGPITSWQIDGETKETVTDFIFLGSKITADGDCTHDIKKTLAPWKKSYDQPRQHIKKQKHYFANKVHLVKAMVFPVVMYGCEIWTIKKAEHWKIDAFQLWCWRRLLRVPWTARRSNQSIVKGISPEYSVEGLILKLKLQYFGPTWCEKLTHWKRPWRWERLKSGGEKGDRRWDGWMASLTQWTWVWVSSKSWWWTGKPSVLQSTGSRRVGHGWVTELNWWTLQKWQEFHGRDTNEPVDCVGTMNQHLQHQACQALVDVFEALCSSWASVDRHTGWMANHRECIHAHRGKSSYRSHRGGCRKLIFVKNLLCQLHWTWWD